MNNNNLIKLSVFAFTFLLQNIQVCEIHNSDVINFYVFANRLHLMNVASRENFKSIEPLDHLKWNPSNCYTRNNRPIRKIPTRQWPNWIFAEYYIINTCHWWKFQIKSTDGFEDTNLQYLQFTDQTVNYTTKMTKFGQISKRKKNN